MCPESLAGGRPVGQGLQPHRGERPRRELGEDAQVKGCGALRIPWTVLSALAGSGARSLVVRSPEPGGAPAYGHGSRSRSHRRGSMPVDSSGVWRGGKGREA
jgi:hypothetical protein